jgi:uncharacterized membrane protein
MPPHFFDLCVILVAGLMVGVELSVAAFVHPAISRLPDHAHAASARALARVFGGWMPFWYTLTLIVSVVEVWTHWRAASSSARWLMAAALLWLLSIVFTLSFPAPLNNRVKSWTLEDLPTNWRQQRRRWDQLHWIRMSMLFIALTSLLYGLLIA